MATMIIVQQQFNYSLAAFIKKNMKKPNIYKIMLKANEIYAENFGYYPENDKVWIEKLCYELLKVIEDYAWQQFPDNQEEARELLWFMSLCELNAPKI